MKEMQVDYDSSRIGARVNATTGLMVGAIISFLVLLILAAVLFVVTREEAKMLGGGIEGVLPWVLGFSFVSTLITVLRNVWWRSRLVKYLVRPSGTPALILDAYGVRSSEGNVLWQDVAEFKITKERFDAGHTLLLQPHGRPPLTFPLDCLSLLPGDLDAAVRAYTHDRIGIDLTGYDH